MKMSRGVSGRGGAGQGRVIVGVLTNDCSRTPRLQTLDTEFRYCNNNASRPGLARACCTVQHCTLYTVSCAVCGLSVTRDVDSDGGGALAPGWWRGLPTLRPRPDPRAAGHPPRPAAPVLPAPARGLAPPLQPPLPPGPPGGAH